MKALIVSLLGLLFAPLLPAAGNLNVYVLDTEGGKAVILVAPSGQTMLVDAGYPRPDDRDTKRIVEQAKALGIREFDYVLVTHYDADHAGNIPSVIAQIPGRVFIDHGPILPVAKNPRYYEAYLAAIQGKQRIQVKPGDTIPIAGLKVTVLTAGGKVLESPLPGAGKTNPACAGVTKPDPPDTDDNAGSIGLLYQFGKFRMADFGDLLSRQEYELMCPNNPVGRVDLFLVSHHGVAKSNSAPLIHALLPKVAIMNNGPRKGGAPAVFDVLDTSPGFEDLWQLHYSPAAKESNAPESFIANMEENCAGKAIHVEVRPNGDFTVTNLRNNFRKSYHP